jgi:putative addiction module killer protein
MINTINEYVDTSGKSLYAHWLESIKDPRTKARIIMQVDKMELGLFGDSKPIGSGLSEMRIHHGPGYRVYFCKEKANRYLLLCGGNKSTQSRDIKRAKEYWKEYERRENPGT